MMHWLSRCLAATVIVMAGAAYALDGKPSLSGLDVFAVKVDSVRLTQFQKGGSGGATFGKLTFRGGLSLSAAQQDQFGGWSGLVVDDRAERFLAISDSGAWMRGSIVYDNGVPQAVADVTMGPIRTFAGGLVKRARDRDAEDLALVSGTPDRGVVQVAFERNARVAEYQVGPNGFSPTRRLLAKPREVAKLSRNSGFEAMTVIKGGPLKGRTVLMAEYFMDANDNHTGWVYTAKGPQRFALTKRDDYSITGLTSLDDGTLFVLERRFRWFDGVRMRIRRIAAGEVKPGATIEGDVLVDAGMDHEVDNMEAIAASRLKDGTVLLTLMSDDNFNHALQRNLLLQFTVN